MKKTTILALIVLTLGSITLMARNGDGTGPSGMGPRTGKGFGICNPNSQSQTYGQGYRNDRGYGKCQRNIYCPRCNKCQGYFNQYK